MTQASPFRRILLKLSGEAFSAGHKDRAFCDEGLGYVASEISSLHALGVELGIVLGGGNLFRGARQHFKGLRRVSADFVGMLATIQNALVLRDILIAQGIATEIGSSLEIPGIVRRNDPLLAAAQLKDSVVIFAGGTGNPYFSTDTAAALRAIEIGAEALFKATTIDGVYDRDPHLDSAAVKYQQLTYQEALAKNLGIMDQAAFALCLEHSTPIVVFDFFLQGNLARAARGEAIGTKVISEISRR